MSVIHISVENIGAPHPPIRYLLRSITSIQHPLQCYAKPSMLSFKDITVKLASQNNCFLTNIPHLVLELKQDERVVVKANLLSRESSRGIWKADKPLVLRETTGEFILSVSMQFDENNCQPVGSIALNGAELYEKVGVQFEIPLRSHRNLPGLILRTKISTIENVQAPISERMQQTGGSREASTVQSMLSEGNTAYHEFKRHGNLECLERAISNFATVTKMTPEGHPDLPGILSNLGTLLTCRFEQLGQVADINNSIERLEKAAALTADNDPSKHGYLGNLGSAIMRRFERFGRVGDINSSIMYQQMALSLTPGEHPDKPMCLSNLGGSLLRRFELFGNVADMENAIIYQQMAISLTPDANPDKPMYLGNLGNSLQTRFKRFGKVEDIDTAITHQQKAVILTPDEHPHKCGHLSHLGNSLLTRFERFGKVDDIDGAIIHQKMAISLTPDEHSGKPLYLSNLASSLMRRFEQFGKLDDMESAIIHQQMAVSLTSDKHPYKPMCLSNLGGSLMRRFQQFGKVVDSDDSVMHQQRAVSLTPDAHPNKPMYLSNIGTSFLARFEQFGKIADIDSSIMHQQKAVSLTPNEHPEKPSRLNNLGGSLKTRFDRFGNVADIDNAIMHQRMAVRLVPDEHPDKPVYLSNLGSSLMRHFERFGKVGDIDSAITNQQMAVKLTPDEHPNKPTYLSNLGNSLWTRFKRFGKDDDMDATIMFQQMAVNLTPNEHPEKSGRLSNLGNSLVVRFERFGEGTDLDSSIMHQETAVNLTPKEHPNKPMYLSNLANALKARFRRFQRDEDGKAVIKYYSASAQSSVGSPTSRFNAVQNWISMAFLTGHDSLLQAYECAIGLMPIVAWLGLPIADRHEHLVKIGSMARDAAAAAISLDQYDKAVEWLEQGRSIVWNQILQLRTPVDELRTINPVLASRLIQVSRLLNQGAEQKEGMKSIEEEGRRYRELTTEWESIIEQVRSLPNFEDFLKSPRISQLRDAAKEGPIVIFNIAEQRCDALALVPGLDKVMHIPLPNITWERVTELRDEFKDMLYSSGIRMRGERAAKRLEDKDGSGDCKSSLAELWTGLVKPVLDSLAFSPEPDVLPRIWWCATGPLAFLPIHAAGLYDDESPGSQVSDYVISSYTPTISSLLPSTEPALDAPFKLLSVIQPSAPGVSSIPNTKEELECIKKQISDREHVILNGREGTKERVTKEMSNSNWVHLACHGSQRQDEPTKSGLILEDGHLTLEEIIKLDLPKAEFAFLSACQTTTGDEALSDEAVHIAGGMLLAGYKGVVATMWSIQDDLAPEVADEFYRRIMEADGRPDNRKAAEALHYSIQKVREKGGVPFTSWIPFVHLGV